MKNRIFLVVILLCLFALAIPTIVYAMPEGIWTSHDTKQYKLWEALNGKGLKKTEKEIAKVNLEKWRIDSHIEMLRETNKPKDTLIDSQGIAFKSDVPISKIRVISPNKEYAEFEPLFSYVYFQDIIDYSTERAAGKNLTILFLSSWYQKSKELVAFSIECHIPEKVEVIPLNQEEASKLFPVTEAKPEE
jgi:hypothetical protein